MVLLSFDIDISIRKSKKQKKDEKIKTRMIKTMKRLKHGLYLLC